MLNNPIITIMPQRLPMIYVIRLDQFTIMNTIVITIHTTPIPILVTFQVTTII
jgi:hypothetical protein